MIRSRVSVYMFVLRIKESPELMMLTSAVRDTYECLYEAVYLCYVYITFILLYYIYVIFILCYRFYFVCTQGFMMKYICKYMYIYTFINRLSGKWHIYKQTLWSMDIDMVVNGHIYLQTWWSIDILIYRLAGQWTYL